MNVFLLKIFYVLLWVLRALIKDPALFLLQQFLLLAAHLLFADSHFLFADLHFQL